MKDKIFSISLILIGITLIIGLSQYLLPPQQISPKETQQILLQPRQKETQQRSFTAFPPLPKRQRNLAYLVVGGDIMFSRNIGYRNKKQGYDRIFGSGNFNPISKFTKCKVDNCVLFFNLESLFHTKDNDIQMGGFTFRANPDNIEVLKQLRTPTEQQQSNGWGRNFPMTLSLTNNHTNNVGYEGILTTQDTLHAGGDFGHIGAGTTSEQAHNIAQYTLNETCENGECKGLSLCFQAYSYDGKENIKVGGGPIFRNPINEQAILNDLKEMETMQCDVKIISLHRGSEYKFSPQQRQKSLAYTLIDNGADLILGGHSHIPGEFETYKGKYIFYSFGNFIFDQDRGKQAQGAEFDYIYDHELSRKTTPTYISLLAGLQFQKVKNGVIITLNQLEMSRMTNGVHQPLDTQTYQEILERIKKN